MKSRKKRIQQTGHAVVEVTLMVPWIFLLFIALLDFGFYAYALISTENAARVGVMYASASPQAAADGIGVCLSALGEMRMLPNVGGSTACACSGGNCTAGPIQTTTSSITGTSCIEGTATSQCARVTVQYQTVQLFPLPFFSGQMVFNRVVDGPVKD